MARSGYSMRIPIPIAAVLVAGCGSVVDGGRSATPPYDGPLDAGAAVGALECEVRDAVQARRGRLRRSLATVQGSAEAAPGDYMRESGLSFSTPSDNYRVEREQDGLVLFSYEEDGRTKVSIFAADGVRDWSGDHGWGVRSWAQCDPSELPPDVTDDLNIGVWEDESGGRVPVTRIQSFRGSEHCAWTDITFLLVGREERADWYVRDASGGDFSELLRTTFANEATLPEAATDTGLRRDGRQLWIGPDEEAAYLVSLDEAQDVEGWPAAKQPIRCA